jgi:CheY-like chemotaxis protein
MAINPSVLPAAIRVLAVEDDPGVAQAIAMVLGGPGCQVTLASGASEALAAIARQPQAFEVVLTDNNMPSVSGTELVRRLRTMNFGGRIVVLSAYVSPGQEAEFRALGVDQLLPKPFEMQELRRAIGL